MTIRRTLLVSFVLFGVACAALMTALAYSRSRAALSAEIRLNLETQSRTLLLQLDTLLYERVMDVQEWRRLDLMQEVRVGDVDKRLARFLHDIAAAHAGVYNEIRCVQKERVIAAADAAAIGTAWHAPAPWTQVAAAGGPVLLAHPAVKAARPVLTLHAAIDDAFSGTPLATLAADVDWGEITRLLDQAMAGTGREAVLLDDHGLTLGRTTATELAPSDLARAHAALPALPASHGVLSVAADGPDAHAPGDRLLVGYARPLNLRVLPDGSWTLLVLTPEAHAFAAVHALLWGLLALLGGITLIAVLLAIRLSARSARPIQALTAYARAVGADIDTPPRVIRGSAEIEELSRAFNRTLDELRHSRERLVRVSKLAAAGEMAAKLAHEVRTPLGIIRSSAQLIGRQDRLDAAGREMMSFMINECDRINDLVTRLLDSARPGPSVLSPHDLDSIVHQVADMLHERLAERGANLEFLPGRDGLVVDCDRDQMVQVVLNLLMNALQVIAQGGRIRIGMRRDGTQIELVVEDDGPGVAEYRRAAIFEPFVSYRTGGIGLGLPVVREIVAAHGGSITVDTGELGGARFSVRLRAAGA